MEPEVETKTDENPANTVCEERAQKYAKKVAAVTGLDEEMIKNAYMKDSGKWLDRYREGIKEWIERVAKKSPVETPAEAEESPVETPTKESVINHSCVARLPRKLEQSPKSNPYSESKGGIHPPVSDERWGKVEMGRRVRIGKKPPHPLYIPLILAEDGFKGETWMIDCATAILIAHPHASIEGVKEGLKIMLSQLELRLDDKGVQPPQGHAPLSNGNSTEQKNVEKANLQGEVGVQKDD